jgi:protein tyrosine phosphatase (PTP) superfamily phosphohydrolase (DUF442 family)
VSLLGRVATATLISLACTALAAQAPKPPDNLIVISERIVTAGQPSAAWLETLKEQRFDAVIYLAPPTVSDAVASEALVVGRQGLVFVNIPINFSKPTGADFMSFARVMDALDGRRVLVHCQVNMRASVMTFLYRVIRRKEDPVAAYEAVSRVWVPQGPWKELIRTQLALHSIDFDPF